VSGGIAVSCEHELATLNVRSQQHEFATPEFAITEAMQRAEGKFSNI
jgi:hypothetical protein